MFRQIFPLVGFGWGIRISGFIDLVLCGVALYSITTRQPVQKEPKPWFALDTLNNRNYILVVLASVFISFGTTFPTSNTPHCLLR